jgi:hypothetical protein
MCGSVLQMLTYLIPTRNFVQRGITRKTSLPKKTVYLLYSGLSLGVIAKDSLHPVSFKQCLSCFKWVNPSWLGS